MLAGTTWALYFNALILCFSPCPQTPIPQQQQQQQQRQQRHHLWHAGLKDICSDTAAAAAAAGSQAGARLTPVGPRKQYIGRRWHRGTGAGPENENSTGGLVSLPARGGRPGTLRSWLYECDGKGGRRSTARHVMNNAADVAGDIAAVPEAAATQSSQE